MISLEVIQKVWQMLGTPDVGGQIAAHELNTVKIPLGNPLVTIDMQGNRHLLIPFPSDIRPAEDKQSAGVHITVNEWGYEGKRSKYIDVICLKPHLTGIFDMMLLDILMLLPKEADHPDRVCKRVLNQWREFLTPEPKFAPDQSKLIGIWGELWMLKQLTQLTPKAVQTWVGPAGGRIDFSVGTIGLEVKTTLQRRGITVTINGHEQLKPPENGNLFFAVLKIEETPITGICINDLINQLIEIGVDRHQLLTALMRNNLTLDAVSQTDDLRFHLHSWHLYHVNEQFPRITSDSFVGGSLPNGVLSINYQIDLSTQPPYPLDEQEKDRFLNQFASEVI